MSGWDTGRLGKPEVLSVDGEQSALRGAQLTATQLTVLATVATLAAIWPLGILFATPAALVLLGACALISAAASASVARAAGGGLFALLPTAVLAGLVIAAAWVRAGSFTALQQAIDDIIGSGQLSQAPLPFLPGWLALTGVLSVMLAAAITLAARATKPLAAIIIAAPFLLVGAVIQPHGYVLVGLLPAISLLLIAAALAHTYATAGRITVKPLLAALAMITAVAAIVFSLSAAGLISGLRTSLAARPAGPVPAAGLVVGSDTIATLRADRPLPLRIGVLSEYRDDGQWLMPPLTPAHVRGLGDGELASQPAVAGAVVAATVELEAEIGRFVPLVPGSYAVEALPSAAQLDDDAQTVMLPSAHTKDLTYTLRVALADRSAPAPAPPVTAIPEEITAALADAPRAPMQRFELLRKALYARGSEGPAPTTGAIAVTPKRAVEIWQGAAASSFEITATEALLASWSGLEVRIGYGWYASTPSGTNTYTITNDNGASWVELRSADGQWYPLVNQPGAEANTPIAIAPDGSRFAEAVIPLQSGSINVSQVVSYWLKRYLLAAVIAVAAWLALPLALRTWRTYRRRRYGQARGAAARVAVAYAQLRDLAIDFDLGNRDASPLAFLTDFQTDEDHRQFAWLVERVLWGDLRRDVTEVEADAAERLAKSLRRRLAGGQTYLRRFVALGSRRSLARPYLPELPNPYPKALKTSDAALARTAAPLKRRSVRIVAGLLAALVLVGIPWLVGTDALRASEDTNPARVSLPATIGDLQAEPVSLDRARIYAPYAADAYINEPQLWVVRADGQAVATVQAAQLKSALLGREQEIRGELLHLFGMNDVFRVGDQVIYTGQLGTLRAALWFAPDKMSYQLLTASSAVADPVAELARIVAAQTEGGAAPSEVETPVLPCDARARTCR